MAGLSLDELLARLDARPSGSGWSARCPAHDDRNPSLTIGVGDGGRILLHCQAGCDLDAVLAALGLSVADLFPPKQTNSNRSGVAATYNYTDEAGALLFQVIRYHPKRFLQRRPDRLAANGWTFNLKGVPRVLYRLPEVIEAVSAGRTIFVCEGEKDAEALRSAGQVATCNPGGAGKWRAEYATVLKSAARVVVVADADEPGRAHARRVAATLEGRVDHLVIVEALVGKDAADHLAAGRTVEEFTVTYDSTEPPTGEPESPGRLDHRWASEVKVVPPVWRWPGWLVAGAVQLLVGRQGAGKSTFAAWTAAQLSTGRPWPGETAARTPMRCSMLSLEEPGGERLAARLVAAGARLDSVAILGDVGDSDEDGRPYRRPWRLPGDCGALEDKILELGTAMVTIDGLGHSINGDSHNYANVGAALSALAGVAERTGCAILGLTHPPKGSSDSITSAIGSTAWTAIPRICWVLGLDPTDDRPPEDPQHRRVIRPAKSNYKLPDHGLSFVIGNQDETEAGFVTNLKPSNVAAAEITSPSPPVEDEEDTEDARSVLSSILGDGPKWVKEILDEMAAAGFSKDQAKRAKSKLHVYSTHFGKPGDAEQGWKWCLPRTRREHEGEEGSAFR